MGGAVAIGRLDLTAEGLCSAASVEKNGAVVCRMLALALISKARPRERGPDCGMDRQTLRDGVHCYNEEGWPGCVTGPVAGFAETFPGPAGGVRRAGRGWPRSGGAQGRSLAPG